MLLAMLNMSLREFAAETGYHYTTGSRLKNGQRLPSRAMVHHLQDCFGLSHEQVADLMQAIKTEGREGSAAWMRANLFGGSE